MSAFLMGLLMLLASFDPLGFQLVGLYPKEARSALLTGAAADFRAHTILVDEGFLASVHKDPKHSQIWASCVLVHEAVHLRENSPREDIPNAFAYVCLDRLGAPSWMKDHLYETMRSQVFPPRQRQRDD